MSESVSPVAFKTAKVLRTICLVLLIVSVALLVWSCILVVTKDVSKFSLLSPILNVCLFTLLFLNNNRVVKKYVKQLEEKKNEQ